MSNCAIVMFDGSGECITAEPFARISAKKSATDKTLAVRSMKAAVSLLWDCQTRAEMDEAELDRYATSKRLVRKGLFSRAIKVLGTLAPKCAESLNLLGIAHESAGDIANARQCYGQASTIDRDCWAAKMNARRIYELAAFGKSGIPMYL